MTSEGQSREMGLGKGRGRGVGEGKEEEEPALPKPKPKVKHSSSISTLSISQRISGPCRSSLCHIDQLFPMSQPELTFFCLYIKRTT